MYGQRTILVRSGVKYNEKKTDEKCVEQESNEDKYTTLGVLIVL
jgi:hypothetical protein